MEKEFTRDEYAECLDTDFIVDFGEGGKVTMKLIEVTEVRERLRAVSFALLFAAPADTPQEQRVFAMENEKLGKTELFLVPVAIDDRGLLFESLFNKLLPRK